MGDIAIRALGLGKKYRKGVKEGGNLFELLCRENGREIFWALRNVSFEVRRGEMFGIIGLNGAGKSTLLKILSRITRPNEGHAEIYGQVGSLLEVGTGFNPELTGRENIYLNGALIGLRQDEIDRKFEEIVEFSGVKDFIDTPIKRYSSGMQVRLGFAVAAHLEQEILLVDEVLSVGDAAFREKSLGKMDEVTGSGRTVVFVGHDLSVISSVCQNALWLEKGVIKKMGNAREITHEYLEATSGGRRMEEGFISLSNPSDQPADKPLLLTHIRLLDQDEVQVPCFKTGQRDARFAIGYVARQGAHLKDIDVNLTILNRRQQSVAACQNTCRGDFFNDIPSAGEFQCTFPKLPLMPGRYKLSVRCKIGPELVHHISNVGEFTVLEGNFYPNGMLPPAGGGDALFDYQWFLREIPEMYRR